MIEKEIENKITTKELKDITSQKKELLSRQREIRKQLLETKSERKAARDDKATARKLAREQKNKLRTTSAKIYEVFSNETSLKVSALADDIESASAELVATIRVFAEAAAYLEDPY